LKLALGTAQFGLAYGVANEVGQVSRGQAKRMLQFAFSRGIRSIDTAIRYGDSETCLGELGVSKFDVVTKLPRLPDGCSDITGWVSSQVASSLARLRVHSLHGLLLHRAEDLIGPHQRLLYRALMALKEEGLVQKIGVSLYSPLDFDSIDKSFTVDLVQAPYNLIDRRLEKLGYIDRWKASGLEVQVRSVFLQGLLLMPKSAIPLYFQRWQVLWVRWHEWLRAHNASPLEACLAFARAPEGVDRVVVGADNLTQLAEIIDASNTVSSFFEWPNMQSGDMSLINPSLWLLR